MEIHETIFVQDHYVSKTGKLSAITILESAFGLIKVEEDVNGREFYLTKKELLNIYEKD
jgi:hypothetical protein